jgi:hypothetical protein
VNRSCVFNLVEPPTVFVTVPAVASTLPQGGLPKYRREEPRTRVSRLKRVIVLRNTLEKGESCIAIGKRKIRGP